MPKGANFGTTSSLEDAEMPLSGLDKAVKYALPFEAQPQSPRDETVEYRTASPWVNITRGDIDRGMDIGLGFSGGGLTTKAPQGIRAYHSSPHDFDKFDLAKIGTGEGAQVYGHGLYFAENPAVSGQGGQYWSQFFDRFQGPEKLAADFLHTNKFDRGEAIRMLTDTAKQGSIPVDQAVDAMKFLRSNRPVGPRTYEVNIRADPAHMLDWDKPLREQQQVLDALSGSRRKAVKETLERQDYLAPTRETYGRDIGPVTGKDFYTALSYNLTGKPGAHQSSGALQAGGIPGIKYLDEGSRFIPQRIDEMRGHLKQDWQPGMREALEKSLAEMEKKPLTYNHVVFDPSIVDIMKKYGLAGLAPLAGYGAMQQGQQPSPQM
jgi:hypothetical protein